MVSPGRRGPARAALAGSLLLIGLLALGVWRVLSGTEPLPYDGNATPPASARVTAGQTYALAVPGGVTAMLAHGVPLASSQSGDLINLQCSWRTPGRDSQTLSVAAEHTDTKAENTVGHFVAPITGPVHVDCAGWGSMFIPDADNRPPDLAGWALVVSVLTLTTGAAVGLSELRLAVRRRRESTGGSWRADGGRPGREWRPAPPDRSWPAGEQDEVERPGGVDTLAAEDEVGGADPGDGGP